MKFDYIKDLPRLSYVYNKIKDLDNYYPNFNNWYFDKFVIDAMLGNSEVILAKNKYNEWLGVSLIKNELAEKKLRALRVFEGYRNKGTGLYLIDESLNRMGVDKPTCTVSEEMLHQYSRIFIERYRFNLSEVQKNMYRKNKLEYIFNT